MIIKILLSLLILGTMFKPRFIKQNRDDKGRFSKRMAAKKKLAEKQIEWQPIINSLYSK